MPSGGSPLVRTKIGTPSWWSPSQRPAMSNVRRPTSTAPVANSSSKTGRWDRRAVGRGATTRSASQACRRGRRRRARSRGRRRAGDEAVEGHRHVEHGGGHRVSLPRADRAVEAVKGVGKPRPCSSRSSSVSRPVWIIVISVPPSRAAKMNSVPKSRRRPRSRSWRPGAGAGARSPRRRGDAGRAGPRRPEGDRPDAADAQVARGLDDPARIVLPVEGVLARRMVNASNTSSSGAAIAAPSAPRGSRPLLREGAEAVEPGSHAAGSPRSSRTPRRAAPARAGSRARARPSR